MSPRAYNLAMSALIFLGFCAMGAGAYFTSTMAFARMMMSGAALPLVFGSFILTIVGIVMMSAAAGKQSVGLSLVGYVVFASTFGLTASFGLANYDLPTINTAFIATAAITFVFGALGVTFPKFFQRVYGIGFGILLATILVEIVLMFMGVSQTITDRTRSWCLPGLLATTPMSPRRCRPRCPTPCSWHPTCSWTSSTCSCVS